MSKELVYLPSGDDKGYVNLARSQQGELFRKKILPMNKSFIHPGSPGSSIFITPEIASSLVKNFGNNLVEHVQTTVVNKDNQHSEDPRDNVGEVIGLDYDENGVYATIDARKHAEDFGKTFLDSSAFLHLDYPDTNTGEKVGPTLLHVAITNRGHVRDMGDYEKVMRASSQVENPEDILFMELSQDKSTDTADISVEQENLLPEKELPSDEEVKPETETKIVLPEKDEEISMTKEEALAFLKDSEGIDVEALLGVKTELDAKVAEAAELSATLEDVNNKLELSGAKVEDIEDLAKSYVALSDAHKTLSTDIEALKLSNATYAKRDAENEVDSLVRVGKVLPSQRDVMVKLSMSDRETFDALVPENPIVKLSEDGVTLHEEPNAAQFDADIERYKALALKLSRPAKN